MFYIFSKEEVGPVSNYRKQLIYVQEKIMRPMKVLHPRVYDLRFLKVIVDILLSGSKGQVRCNPRVKEISDAVRLDFRWQKEM